MKVDVAVIGGGPAGLSSAHAIRRANPDVTVAVFERSDIRPRGASFGVLPNGIRALEAIDPALLVSLQRHHTSPEKARRFDAAGTLVFSTDEGGLSGMSQAVKPQLNLAWHSLQRELAQALPQGVLHTQHRFLGYREAADGVQVELATPQGVRQVSAQLLVGCDGGQSLVRNALLDDGPPNYLGVAIWRAVRPVPADWPIDHGWVSYGALGTSSILTSTLGNGTLAWQAFVPWPADQLGVIGGGRRAYIQEGEEGQGNQAAGDAGPQRLARVLACFDAFPDAVKQLIAGTDPAAITEHGQFARDAEQCQTYAKGRVALVGDAAHMMTPTLAQGCSQALEDALELGRAIGCLGPTPAALAEYEQIRLPMASPVQAASVQLFSDILKGKAKFTSELETNRREGFLDRLHAPLRPAAA
ncbi:hypothetical protein D9Q98_008869 [Chlorella vulgaris]|uniref:FAD-binding domain-containing protein n=1 Tax=Chlorella vulgaris TaxID=3077 RepID=A0A9D4TIU6_CHLVU|nr:hypothetical protein D9Q98_008869 [Chlorella vulgaris]